MIKKFFLLILCTLTASSCSMYRISSEDTSTGFYPSKVSINEVIYVENIDRPHEEVGQITINAERRQRLNDIIEKMKREAAILGADAITNIESDATGVWKKLPAQQFVGNAYVRANFTAKAVVFK